MDVESFFFLSLPHEKDRMVDYSRVGGLDLLYTTKDRALLYTTYTLRTA